MNKADNKAAAKSRRARPLRRSAIAYMGLLPLLGAASSAYADRMFNPYASAEIENDSNIFSVPSQFPVVDPRGQAHLSDNYETYILGTDFDYLFDLQHLYATFEAREMQYDRFTDLNHSEYLINLGLNWKLTTRFDGIIDGRREKKMIAFSDDELTTLQIQTDQIVKGTFNVALTPKWRLETLGSVHTLDYPIAQSPDFRLTENQEGIGLKYVGIANLSYGIQGTHLDGTYSGANAANYKQNTEEFALKYTLRQVTRVSAAIGYTERTIEGSASSVSGVTGLLGYERQLTGKTSVDVVFQRAVNSYYTAGSSEIDTGGTVSALWQATPKIGVAVSFQRQHSEFEGETLADAFTLGRTDNASNSSLEVRYKPVRWLTIRPYVKRQVRTSNIELFTYNNTAVGVEFVAQRDERIVRSNQ